jgi:hypothetical protein
MENFNKKEAPVPPDEHSINYERTPYWEKTLEETKKEVHPNEEPGIDYQPVPYWDKPLEQVKKEVHPNEELDVWTENSQATPVKKLEKEAGLKPSMPRSPGSSAEHVDYGAENESLIKTEEDAERIAAIKKMAAEEKQKERDEKKKAGIYEKIKALFGS